MRELINVRRYASSIIPYTGPGDVQAFVHWWGLRAFTQATIGQNVVKLRRDSDNATQDFATISGGGLDNSAISSFKGAANLFVDTLYDQGTGGRNVGNGTLSGQPAFGFNLLNSRPAMTFVAANSQELAAAATPVTINQPYCWWIIGNSNSTTPCAMLAHDNGGGSSPNIGVTNSANWKLESNTILNAAVAINTWHSDLGLCNNTSSQHYLDGVGQGAGAGGTTGLLGASNGIHFGGYSFNGYFDGMLAEGGIINGDASANAAALQATVTGFYV